MPKCLLKTIEVSVKQLRGHSQLQDSLSNKQDGQAIKSLMERTREGEEFFWDHSPPWGLERLCISSLGCAYT